MISQNKFCLFVAVILTLVYYFVPIGQFNNIFFDVCLVLAGVAVYSFINLFRELPFTNIWIKPSNIIFISLLIVSFQFLIDYRLGIKEVNGALYPSTLNKVACLGLISVLAFVAGYRYAFNEYCIKESKVSANNYSISSTPLQIIQLILFILFVISNGLSNLISGAAYYGARGSMSEIASYSETLLYAINIAIVTCNCINDDDSNDFSSYWRNFPTISKYVFVAYLVLRLLSGDRGPLIYNTAMIFFGFIFTTKREIKFTTAIVIFCVGAITINVIGIARGLDNSMSVGDKFMSAAVEYNSNGRFGGRYDMNSISPATSEIAGSIRITEIAVNNIENQNDVYTYGFMHLIHCFNCIPFSSHLYRDLPIPEQYFSSGRRANYLFFGGFEHDWSIGTNMISDFYWDFGVIGVLLLSLLVGYLFFKIDSVLLLPNNHISPYALVFALTFASVAVYIPRATMFSFINVFCQSSFILWLFREE